ncbi:MAG: chemotaxis response regulator protein-glutamate methylesterase [Ignavibacteriota bacterium]|nr:chemotaxis response regulator protein-glutamate methylesterase [Ignavibacteriota bacterium]MCO6448236.1 chemotaxis response regulator protein-glutamate methylesterase [Ignavibacterium album]QKK00241.1 MAG: chemotaxis response regulator protein-glutamate methylesterase [Ignavibacteriota bacterium]HOJ06319.1 chemotaxis response regulator protein-glutamate methylesterase [Ignavibacteriaceae bacterium]
MSRKIKALVVDDSAFMRKSLSMMLESTGEIEVIAAARDGQEGVELVKSKLPDIVTMDIEMPRMDGLTALEKIMKECPTPVLMISSLTTEGAKDTIKALELGAVDFIPKELSYINVNIIKIKEDLISKVKAIVSQRSLSLRLQRIQNLRINKGPVNTNSTEYVSKAIPKIGYKAVALGVSTGGPMSLQKVVPKLAENFSVPMFIVQHMPPKFTKSLAERLNGLSSVEVKEAENNEIVKAGVVYIAPGGMHMTVERNSANTRIVISENPADTLHRPSVDVMLNSVIQTYGKYVLGVIMTGMGRDGADAIKELKIKGGYSIAQNEETCVVYGMPKAIIDSGYADSIVPLEKIATEINKAVI